MALSLRVPVEHQHLLPVEYKYKIALSVLLCAVLGGMANAVTIVLEQVMIQQNNRTNYDVFVAGALYLLPSIPVAFPFGYWIDVTEHETALAAGVYVSTALLQLVVLSAGVSLPTLYAAISVYGATTNMLSTACLPSSNRWANGNHAKLINTVLSYLNNFFSLLLTVLFSVLSVHASLALNWTLVALCLAGTLLMFCIRTV
jgi:hypothetical protein